MSEETETCEHKNWYIDPNGRMGYGYCPDCDKYFRVSTLLNAMINRFRKIIEKAEVEA